MLLRFLVQLGNSLSHIPPFVNPSV